MMRRKRKLKTSVFVVLTAVIVLAAAAVVAVIHNRTAKENGGASSQSQGASSSDPAASSDTANSSGAASSQTGSSGGMSATSPSGSQGTSSVNTGEGSLLMLVNKDQKLPASYQPSLTNIASKYYSSSDKDRRFDQRAAPYLIKMMDDARTAGYDLDVISGYRTYAYQKSNFDRHVSAFLKQGMSSSQATAQTALVVAPPGTSEHQTGLACDIVTSDWYTKNTELTAAFDQTPAFKWLFAHCADYGFILRYLKDKQDVTKYDYEPWHYRFVGVADAKKIMASGVCLEEYVKR